MAWERGNYDTRRYHERRQRMLDLLGGKCWECESEDNLQVHHQDPKQKSFTLADSGWTRPWNQIEDELRKCVLLCGICHGKKHATSHGKRRMYNRGCRCDKCREAHNFYVREYRKKHPRPRSSKGQSVSLPN